MAAWKKLISTSARLCQESLDYLRHCPQYSTHRQRCVAVQSQDPNVNSSLRNEVSHDVNTPVASHDVSFADVTSLSDLSDTLSVDDMAVFFNDASQLYTLNFQLEDPSEEFFGTMEQFVDCWHEEFFFRLDKF